MRGGGDCCCEKFNGCKGPTLCHTQPDIDWSRFHIDAGFILEQAVQSRSQYANDMTGTSTALPEPGRKIFFPAFNLDFGVTCAVGYDFEHDHWYTNARFDWLQTTGSGSAASTFDKNIIPANFVLTSYGAATNYAALATSTFQISYYNLMLDIGRGSYISDCLALSPHIGLKLSFIYDAITNQFSGGGVDVGQQITETANSNFWGIGPGFGIDSDWGFTEGWSVFLDTNIAILLAHQTASGQVISTENPSTNIQSMSTGNLFMLTPTMRTILGILYERKIYCNEQLLSGRIGLDTSIYWNQYNLIAGASSQVTGQAFGLTGLIAELGWKF